MRKIASVVTIESVEKMFEKDRIVCAHMVENAYEVIIPNTFKVGDKMVFIQEGSVLPETETWEFLRKRCYNETWKGFIIKPMTMGKKEAKDENGNPVAGTRVKSWGLAVGLNECGLTDDQVKKLKAEDDITDLLNIRKYEPEEDASPKAGSKKAYPKWVKFCLSHVLTRWIGRIYQKRHQNSSGGFPTNLVQKSDETTLQNMKGTLEKFAETRCYTSAKIEGQSFTVVPTFKKTKYTGAYVCSRNNAYNLEDKSTFWDCMRKYNIVNGLKNLYKETGKSYIIQGEQVGEGIRDNIYNFKGNVWFVYLVIDYETGKQLTLDEMISVCGKLGLQTVPIIDRDVLLKDIMPNLEAAVTYAETKYWRPVGGGIDYNYAPRKGEKLWVDYLQHEGVVVRSMDCDKMGNVGFSTKVKNINYSEKGLGNMHKIAVELGKTA